VNLNDRRQIIFLLRKVKEFIYRYVFFTWPFVCRRL